MFGYSLAQDEFEFEYFDDPQTLEDPETSEISQNFSDEPVIIEDFEKYEYSDYSSICEELEGFRLGEVVYDQCGEIGVIIAFFEMGSVRLDSNGTTCVDNLKKCPRTIAIQAVKSWEIVRPEKSLSLSSDMSQNTDVKVFQQSNDFHKIIKTLRNNIAKGHTFKTIQKNCKVLRELVHDPFFRSVTAPYYSHPQDCPVINREAVTEFLRRVDLLAKGDNVEESLSLISRYSSMFYTMKEIIDDSRQSETQVEVSYGDIEISPVFSDLEEKAVAAYRLQSREPERRGAETLDVHLLQVTKDTVWIPVNKRAAYLEKYEALLGAWLDAMARVVSPEVVGKAAFSKRRNEKAQKSADKLKQRLDGFRLRSLYRYRRKDPAA